MKPTKDQERVLSALRSTAAGHLPFIIYATMLEFRDRRLSLDQLAAFTDLGRTTVQRGRRVLYNLGVAADGKLIDDLSPESLGLVMALADRKISIESSTGDLFRGVEEVSCSETLPVGGHPEVPVDGHSDSEQILGGVPVDGHPLCPPAGTLEDSSSEAKSKSGEDLQPSLFGNAPDFSVVVVDTSVKAIRAQKSSKANIKVKRTTKNKRASDAEPSPQTLRLLDEQVTSVLDYWYGRIKHPVVQWTALTDAKLQAQIKGQQYRAVARALKLGYTPEQLRAIADYIGSNDWLLRNARQRIWPSGNLRTAEEIDRKLFEAKGGRPPQKIAQDRRGLGLGMRRPGEADTDHVELF